MDMDSFMSNYGNGVSLMHYGISGQKKGVRRFQNEDGSLTPEGRERYLKGLDTHRKQIYGDLTEYGKSRVDYHLQSGKDFDDAVRSGLQDARKARFKSSMLRMAAQFIAGAAAYKIGGNAYRRGHAFLGSFLKGFGGGSMAITPLSGLIVAAGNAASKARINNLDIGKDLVTPQEQEREERRRNKKLA